MRSDRTLPIVLSVLVHAAVVALLGWGWWRYRAPKAAPRQLAIEATIVVDKTLTPAPAPSSAAPAPVAPIEAPQQQAERELERRERQRQQQEQIEREQRAADERAAADARRREQEAAARKAAEAVQRRAQDKARRESELRAQLAVEERIDAARGSAAAVQWMSLIRDRVTQAWIRPPSARPGVDCEVHVTQVPGGVVTGVQIGSCNGDAAVRESIEAAVYRASPLPSPTNPDIFDRNLTFSFHPDE